MIYLIGFITGSAIVLLNLLLFRRVMYEILKETYQDAVKVFDSLLADYGKMDDLEFKKLLFDYKQTYKYLNDKYEHLLGSKK